MVCKSERESVELVVIGTLAVSKYKSKLSKILICIFII